MATPITNLGLVEGQNLSDELFDPEELAAAERLLQAYLQSSFPKLNLTGTSSLYDLNIRPRAVSYMISRAEWTALRATQSLKGVIENPELASAAIVDAILSNLLLTRRLGGQASGRVRVNLTTGGIYTVPSEMRFVSPDGLQFAPKASYRVLAEPIDDEDLKLYSDSTGSQFYFLVPVQAVENGLKYQLANGVSMTITPSIPNLILAETFGNFGGGADDETNEELIARIPEGQSVKNQVSPLAIRATLKEEFPEILDLAVQGMNGPAMTRNAHNLMGVKTGGFADIYIRTGTTTSLGEISKTATLIDIAEEDNSATYKVELGRDDFPGHYGVRGILPEQENVIGSFLIIQEDKTFDARVDANDAPAGTNRPNKIETVQEAAYSRFQSTTVLFRVEYDVTLGTQPNDQFPAELAVTVSVNYLPLVKEVQQFISDRDRGVVMADYLVRAVIPCFVQLSTIIVEAAFGTSASDIRLAVFNYVNSIKIGERLRMDEVVSAIKKVTGVKYVQLPIKPVGKIYAPNGTIIEIHGDSGLVIPSRPEMQVVPETTAFFIELPDIPVALSES